MCFCCFVIHEDTGNCSVDSQDYKNPTFRKGELETVLECFIEWEEIAHLSSLSWLGHRSVCQVPGV